MLPRPVELTAGRSAALPRFSDAAAASDSYPLPPLSQVIERLEIDSGYHAKRSRSWDPRESSAFCRYHTDHAKRMRGLHGGTAPNIRPLVGDLPEHVFWEQFGKFCAASQGLSRQQIEELGSSGQIPLEWLLPQDCLCITAQDRADVARARMRAQAAEVVSAPARTPASSSVSSSLVQPSFSFSSSSNQQLSPSSSAGQPSTPAQQAAASARAPSTHQLSSSSSSSSCSSSSSSHGDDSGRKSPDSLTPDSSPERPDYAQRMQFAMPAARSLSLPNNAAVLFSGPVAQPPHADYPSAMPTPTPAFRSASTVVSSAGFSSTDGAVLLVNCATHESALPVLVHRANESSSQMFPGGRLLRVREDDLLQLRIGEREAPPRIFVRDEAVAFSKGNFFRAPRFLGFIETVPVLAIFSQATYQFQLQLSSRSAATGEHSRQQYSQAELDALAPDGLRPSVRFAVPIRPRLSGDGGDSGRGGMNTGMNMGMGMSVAGMGGAGSGVQSIFPPPVARELTPRCSLHEQAPLAFKTNQKILVSLLRRLPPEVFQRQVELARTTGAPWKFPPDADKTTIMQSARNDELLRLLPPECTCISPDRRYHIHRMARVKDQARARKMQATMAESQLASKQGEIQADAEPAVSSVQQTKSEPAGPQ